MTSIKPIIMIISTTGASIRDSAAFPATCRTNVWSGSYDQTEVNPMNEIDDLDIKAEIDEISKKIDSIVRRIEQLDPDRQEPEKSQN